MDQDKQNLDLLGIFHFVLGGMTCLFSNFFLIYVFMGLMLVREPFKGKSGPPDGFGWMFVAIGSVLVLLGWALGVLMLVAGRNLRRHTLRTFCLVIAGLECMITPLGTVLGVFTIITLMKESVVARFDTTAQERTP
jgi:hypothetical protein